MTSPKYADVAPAVPLSPAARQTYTYQLPTSQTHTTPAQRFSSVAIPFGPRTVPGVVLKLHNRKQSGPSKTLKAISTITLTDQQVQFARWIARLAQGGLGYTLRLFQPPTKRPSSSGVVAPEIRTQEQNSAQGVSKAIINKHTAQRHAALARIAWRCVAQGTQALILVPERWMTQPLARACAAASPGPVAIVHAGISASRLTTTWHQIKSGGPSIVIGTQKALFLPYRNLALVAVEEEHLQSHKLWDQYPRLHNIYAAEKLADLHRAALVYSTSFPSLRLRHAMAKGLVEVIGNQPVKLDPRIITFSFDDRANQYPLPKELLTKLRRWQRQGESTLLYYNRKSVRVFNDILNKCVKDNHPNHFTLATSAVFTAKQHKYDHVVWLFPERDLYFPDFRASERLLITGARLQQAHVTQQRRLYVVTRRDLVTKLLNGDVAGVTKSLLAERKRYGYPPFTDLVRLTTTAKTRRAAFTKGVALRQAIEQRLAKSTPAPSKAILVRGPYHTKENTVGRKQAAHLVVTGPLEALAPLYDGLSVDMADLAPAQIV